MGKSLPMLFRPGKGTHGQELVTPGAADKVLQKQKCYPPKWPGKFRRCSTHPLGHPLPVGTESGERGRERVGEGVPTTKLFLLLLRQLGKKQGINLGKQRTGRTGQARTRRSWCVMPVPGTWLPSPIDYGSPAAGKIHPQGRAKGLFLTMKRVVEVPRVLLARRGGSEAGSPVCRNRKRDVKGGSDGNTKRPQPDLLHHVENAPPPPVLITPLYLWSLCHSGEDSWSPTP